MADDGHYFRNSITKHSDDVQTFYTDFGPWLKSGVTIASAGALATTDSGMTVDQHTLLSSGATDVPDVKGDRDIAANQGTSFRVSGGTAIDDDAAAAEVKVTVTLSDGSTIARLARVRVKD